MDFLDFIRKVAEENKQRFIEKHYGPGPHKSGSPQSVHGGKGKKGKAKAGSMPSTKAKAGKAFYSNQAKRAIREALPKGLPKGMIPIVRMGNKLVTREGEFIGMKDLKRMISQGKKIAMIEREKS